MDWPRYLLWPLLALSLFLAGKGILREQSVRREQSLRREGHRLSRFRGPLALAGICIVCFSLINVVGFLPFAFIMAGGAVRKRVVVGKSGSVGVGLVGGGFI